MLCSKGLQISSNSCATLRWGERDWNCPPTTIYGTRKIIFYMIAPVTINKYMDACFWLQNLSITFNLACWHFLYLIATILQLQSTHISSELHFMMDLPETTIYSISLWKKKRLQTPEGRPLVALFEWIFLCRGVSGRRLGRGHFCLS